MAALYLLSFQDANVTISVSETNSSQLTIKINRCKFSACSRQCCDGIRGSLSWQNRPDTQTFQEAVQPHCWRGWVGPGCNHFHADQIRQNPVLEPQCQRYFLYVFLFQLFYSLHTIYFDNQFNFSVNNLIIHISKFYFKLAFFFAITDIKTYF